MSPTSSLTISELERLSNEIEQGRCLLLDVRERREYEDGHIPSAAAAPLSQIESWSADLDRRRKTILYCRTGGRARRCADMLAAKGFTDVLVLDGGYSAWSSRPSPK